MRPAPNLRTYEPVLEPVLEPDHSLDDEPVELSAVAQVVPGIPRELLLHVLELAHDHRRQEHPRAELPPVGSRLALDACQLTLDGVVARGDEQFLVRADTINRVQRVLMDVARRRLGRRLAFRALHDTEEFEPA